MVVSILQWNIWYEEDIHNIAAFLKTHKTDIICLQELVVSGNQNAAQFIAEQLGYDYHYKDLQIEGTDDNNWRLANGIFSHFPIINRHWAWINQPKGRGGYDDEYRAYVEVTLDIEGDSLNIGTTHMSYTHRFEETQNKKHEAQTLVTELAKHQNNFIFTGDLNVTPDSEAIDKLNKILRHAGPDFSQKTWTTKPFSYNGFEENDLNWRLDYIFATPDLKIVSSESLKTDYSDHLPILAHFEI